jgi:hypothetical protein
MPKRRFSGMEKWHIYVEEARTQIRFAQRSYREFEKARDANDVEAVFYCLHHFLVHAVAVDRILDLNHHPDRAAILSSRLDLRGIDMKPARRVRNHLEHFDERLDKWISKHYGRPFFDMNIITGSVGFPYDAALRALDGDTLRFMGEEYSLPEMLQEISALDERLALLGC